MLEGWNLKCDFLLLDFKIRFLGAITGWNVATSTCTTPSDNVRCACQPKTHMTSFTPWEHTLDSATFQTLLEHFRFRFSVHENSIPSRRLLGEQCPYFDSTRHFRFSDYHRKTINLQNMSYAWNSGSTGFLWHFLFHSRYFQLRASKEVDSSTKTDSFLKPSKSLPCLGFSLRSNLDYIQ